MLRGKKEILKVREFKKKKKVQVGNDQEMVQSERNSHSINRAMEKN